jgi:cell wall-associated NlpC family hydrolase
MRYEELIGRPFELGRYDCFTMVRDFYAENFNIPLTNYARPNDWDADTVDIIGLTYEREGFFKVDDWTLKNLNPGDLLCMAIGTSKANHMAVYIGGNQIVHHKIAAMSDVEILRDFWRKSICYVLRHKDVPVIEVEKPTIDIMELLDARNRLQPDS